MWTSSVRYSFQKTIEVLACRDLQLAAFSVKENGPETSFQVFPICAKKTLSKYFKTKLWPSSFRCSFQKTKLEVRGCIWRLTVQQSLSQGKRTREIVSLKGNCPSSVHTAYIRLLRVGSSRPAPWHEWRRRLTSGSPQHLQRI